MHDVGAVLERCNFLGRTLNRNFGLEKANHSRKRGKDMTSSNSEVYVRSAGTFLHPSQRAKGPLEGGGGK